ncbi:hypothetical protein D3C76_1186610 [compost metagenome]
MALGDEVVLPAHATEYPAILQLVGHPGAEQGHAEYGVDEARITALAALEFLLPVQLVDEADTRHGKPCALFQRHVAQALVERLGAEEETAMQHCRHLLVRRAPQQARFGQRQQAVDEHLAAAVQALGEGIQAPFPFDQRLPRASTQRVEHGTITGVVTLARQQGGSYRIAHGTNADL